MTESSLSDGAPRGGTTFSDDALPRREPVPSKDPPVVFEDYEPVLIERVLSCEKMMVQSI
jgi:hypothetical protein